jgi:hypothetical protein
VLVVPISRVEIAEHVRDVFTGGPATRTELFAGAADHGARSAVLHTLQRLPGRVEPAEETLNLSGGREVGRSQGDPTERFRDDVAPSWHDDCLIIR